MCSGCQSFTRCGHTSLFSRLCCLLALLNSLPDQPSVKLCHHAHSARLPVWACESHTWKGAAVLVGSVSQQQFLPLGEQHHPVWDCECAGVCGSMPLGKMLHPRHQVTPRSTPHPVAGTRPASRLPGMGGPCAACRALNLSFTLRFRDGSSFSQLLSSA